MMTHNRNKTFLKPGDKILGNLKLRQRVMLKSHSSNNTPEVLYERAEKNTGEKLAGYYAQLFFLS